MRCGFVLYNYSIRKNITNKPFSLGAKAFPCNLQTYEEQQVSLKQQVTYKCKHWLIVNARLNVIHTSQFQLVNLGNTTRKKILVCKKVRGEGGGHVLHRPSPCHRPCGKTRFIQASGGRNTIISKQWDILLLSVCFFLLF